MLDSERPRLSGPETVDEWIEFVLNDIPLSDLIHQARVAGSPSFMRLLRQEGYTCEDLDAIHNAYVKRFLVEEIRIPQEMQNCSINYYEKAEQLKFEKELKKL